jgi:uncharacterized membrane protein
MYKTIPTVLVMILAWSGLYLLAACGQGEKTLAEADPGAAPLDPPFTMVWSIIDRSCVPCHKGEDDGEQEVEGDDMDLSTCTAIKANVGGIVMEAIDNESMPPGAWPRLTEREKLILRRWIANGAQCP